jgi:ABC-2 type transport system permease protein
MLMSRAIAGASAGRSSFATLLVFEVRRAARNRRYLLFTLAFPALIYLLYTQILPAGGPGTVDGLAWPAYFMVSMAVYGAMGAALSQTAPIAVERRGGWIRQLRTTPIAPAAYVAAKVAAGVLLTAPALVFVTIVGVVANHVVVDAPRAVALVGTVAVGSLPFAALAVVLGYILDAESAQGGMVLLYFGMAILGGLFAPLDALPPVLATIGRVLPASHLAGLGHAAAAGRLPDPLDVVALGAWTVALGAVAAWRYRRDERAGHA